MILPTPQRITSYGSWLRHGESLFGPDRQTWRFVCPSCCHIASIAQWLRSGAPESAVGFSCIGRYPGSGVGPQVAASQAFGRSGGPCNYTGAGLFNLNPVTIEFDDGREATSSFEFDLPAALAVHPSSSEPAPAEVK
jgi:hypothetical protein